jgi:hypothetical protein
MNDIYVVPKIYTSYNISGIDSFNITLREKNKNNLTSFLVQCIEDKIITRYTARKIFFADGNAIDKRDVYQRGLRGDVNTIFEIGGILGYQFASKPIWNFIQALVVKYGKQLMVNRIDYCIDFKMDDYNKFMNIKEFHLFFTKYTLGRIKLEKAINDKKHNTQYILYDNPYFKIYWYNKHIKKGQVRTINAIVRVEISLTRKYLIRSVIKCGTMEEFVYNYNNITKELLSKINVSIMGDEVYFNTETTDIKIEEFVKYIQSEIPYPPYMERNDTNNVKNTKFIKKVIALSERAEYRTKSTNRPNVQKISEALGENKNKVGNIIKFLALCVKKKKKTKSEE